MAVEFDTGLAEVSSWAYPTTISVSFWYVWLQDKTTHNRFFGFADNFEIRMQVSDHKFYNELFKSTGTASTAAYNPGVWQHIVCTANKSTGAGTMYIDGVLDNSTTGHTGTPASPATLGIGGRYGSGGTQCAGGIMEDVRVYNRILTAQDVKILFYNDGTDLLQGGLINHWIYYTKGGAGATSANGYTEYDIVGKQGALNNTGNFWYWGGRKAYRRKTNG